jgi:hypothetical protein
MSLLALVLPLLGGARGSDDFSAVRSALRRSAPGEVLPAEVLVQRLGGLGDGAVPLLYALANGRGLEALTAPEWVQESWLCRPEEISVLAARALERAPREAVRAEFVRALDAQPGLQERLILLRLAGGQASVEALALLWRNLRELGELELGRPSVRRDAVSALAAILGGDARVWKALRESSGDLGPDLMELLVEAVGTCGQARGMALLREFLERDLPADETVLEAMATLEASLPWELAGQTFRACSSWLEHIDPSRRAFAAHLAGRLHASEAVPALIERLEDSEALVRLRVLGALSAMAGMDLGSRAETWRAWHDCELAWREQRWDALLARLVDRRAGIANEALMELVQHPFHRHEVAQALAETLLRQPRVVALASCAELARLGSRVPVQVLVSVRPSAPPKLAAGIGQLLAALEPGPRSEP